MNPIVPGRSGPAASLPPIIGTSASIQLAQARLARFAASKLPVLLVGPTGTGKELLARHLHHLSGRRGRLVDVNCGALPREMIESLLFGHRKGAFTGAVESTNGMVARADLGTLFLDELSSLPLEGQAKLLRVIESGEVLPLGAEQESKIDFRLIAAVHDDIDGRIESGAFRRDLFHRVAGVRIEVPALAARPEDIGPLAEFFAAGRGCVLSPAAIATLRSHQWPGNVRELRAVIERATVLADTPILNAEVVAQALGGDQGVSTAEVIPTRGGISTPLRAPLLQICEAHSGEVEAITRTLGVSRATLFRWLRARNISLTELRISRSLTRAHQAVRLRETRESDIPRVVP